MKKVFECPDCGKKYDNVAPAACDACGCPANLFVVVEVEEEQRKVNSVKQAFSGYGQQPVGEVDAETAAKLAYKGTQKIYLEEPGVVIASKVWEFGGYRVSDYSEVRKFIPVSAVASVDYCKPKYAKYWLVWCIISLLCVIGGIIIIIDLYNMEVPGTVMILLGIIFILLSLYFRNKRELLIYTNNSSSTFHFDGVAKEDALRYLAIMKECLIENR